PPSAMRPTPPQPATATVPQVASTPPSSPSPPATQPTPTPSQTLTAATPKRSFSKKIIMMLGGLFILTLLGAGVFWFLNRDSNTPSTQPDTSAGQTNRQVVSGTQTTITYWGLWEPSEVLKGVLADFEEENQGVTVAYTQQSYKDYRERLQSSIANGSGPDVFRFHASWVPMLKKELSPVPNSVISTSSFQSAYYPIASQQLQSQGQLLGIPLMYDGLALYYNKELLRTANAQPPKTWSDLRTLAKQLTVSDGSTIQRGGLAAGNATNVEHFSDIIGLLMLQNGADITKPNTAQARDALLFYTNFIRADNVWSDTLPSSTVAFARGDAAMMFAPSWRVHEIKALNPQLDFAIAPVPQLTDESIAWGTYWAEGVSTASEDQDAAWKLISYLSSDDVLRKLHSDASQVRAFGELYPKPAMAAEIDTNELVQPFLADAEHAQGGYLSSYTHDNGINDQLIEYYERGVTSLLSGQSIDAVMTTIEQGTTQVLRTYGLTTTSTTTSTTTQ
ncbi:extracellular solute-binding protein, partial [Candidatus Woesebacteria bacterium]|nr:extracellular solute-binding protein [Candidatus Woesebacteria bacterium]